MESKFASLLNRFESYVSNAEGTGLSDPMLDRFEQLIERLEKIHYASSQQPTQPAPAGGAPAGGATGGSPYLQKFKDSCFINVPALLEVTKEHGNEQLLAGTNLYLDLLNSQEAVFRTMGESSKPGTMAFMSAIVQEKKKGLFDLGKPGRAVGTHLRCLEDSVGMYCWFQCPETAADFNLTFGDLFGAIDFQGEKLCDMQPIDKKWFQSLRKVHKDFFDFIKAEFPKVLKWSGAGASAEQVYKAALGSLGASAPAAQAAPVQAATPAKQEEAKKAAAAPEKKPKAPVKALRFKTWEIANFGQETVEFSADEVQVGMTFNVFNCEKTTIIINGKFKNCMLSRCKNVKITVEEAISTAEIIKSENIQFKVLKKMPTISVEHCNGVQVFTNHESKDNVIISTTASQSVSLVYPRLEGTYDPNDEEEPDTWTGVVPETFSSKLVNEKLETVAVELHD